jgi:hypothetical protein
MKIKSIAAVGAMGVGLGLASFIGGTGTASAECGLITTPPLERANCLVSQDLAGFADSINPANQINTFLNGDPADTPYGSLGITQQLSTFQKSITGTPTTTGFLGGPISSQDPKAPQY